MSTSTTKAKPLDPGTQFLIGTPGNDHLRGGAAGDLLDGLGGRDLLRGQAGGDTIYGGLGNDRLWGGEGDDTLMGQPFASRDELRAEVNLMRGGAGDDVYYVHGAGDRVIEKAGEGVDTVRTTIGFTLPEHVENMVAYYLDVIDGRPLVGNALDNHIVGTPFGYDTILGLDGNDTLDGGTRQGAFLDGGNGDDVLLQPFGECLGGAGADLFVARGRGAMTVPDVAVAVLDFDAAEGDRIHIVSATRYDSAALFESGQLRFDVEDHRLVLDFDQSSPQPGSSPDQVVLLPGVEHFDPAWVSVGPMV